MELPAFTHDGVLPRADYELSFPKAHQSVLVLGREGTTGPHWDCDWRRHLLENAEVLVEQLWSVGISNVFLDGSFVEAKDHPGDIDGYFECPWERLADGELEQSLNLLDPHSVWTWNDNDRQLYAGKMRLPMWIHYRVELYPHPTGLPTHSPSGIRDEHGNELEFPAAFRQSRSFRPKGILKLKP